MAVNITHENKNESSLEYHLLKGLFDKHINRFHALDEYE